LKIGGLGLRPAVQWSDETRLRELFGERITSLHLTSREVIFRYRSPAHMLQYFRTWYGPTNTAFGALDEDRREALTADLLKFFRRHNRSADTTPIARSRYARWAEARHAGGHARRVAEAAGRRPMRARLVCHAAFLVSGRASSLVQTAVRRRPHGDTNGRHNAVGRPLLGDMPA